MQIRSDGHRPGIRRDYLQELWSCAIRPSSGKPRSLARHDMGLSTVIGRTDKDASGRMLDGAMRSTMGRLRAWDFRTQAHSPTDRNLRQAFSELDRLKDKLGVSDAVIEKTAYIYRKAQ